MHCLRANLSEQDFESVDGASGRAKYDRHVGQVPFKTRLVKTGGTWFSANGTQLGKVSSATQRRFFSLTT